MSRRHSRHVQSRPQIEVDASLKSKQSIAKNPNEFILNLPIRYQEATKRYRTQRYTMLTECAILAALAAENQSVYRAIAEGQYWAGKTQKSEKRSSAKLAVYHMVQPEDATDRAMASKYVAIVKNFCERGISGRDMFDQLVKLGIERTYREICGQGTGTKAAAKQALNDRLALQEDTEDDDLESTSDFEDEPDEDSSDAALHGSEESTERLPKVKGFLYVQISDSDLESVLSRKVAVLQLKIGKGRDRRLPTGYKSVHGRIEAVRR